MFVSLRLGSLETDIGIIPCPACRTKTSDADALCSARNFVDNEERPGKSFERCYTDDSHSSSTSLYTLLSSSCCSRFTKSKPTNVVTVVSITPKAGIVLTLFEALKKDGNTSTRRIPLRLHDSNVRFSGTIDLMKTVYPREDGYRASLSLSIVPEDPEEEEVISVLSNVVPAMEGKTTKKRRLPGFVELVIDMAFIMQRTFFKARRASAQESSTIPSTH